MRLGYEVLPLRWEVERLRAEAGHLVVDTNHLDRIQAIGVPEYTDLTWKWKVYFPPEKNIGLYLSGMIFLLKDFQECKKVLQIFGVEKIVK